MNYHELFGHNMAEMLQRMCVEAYLHGYLSVFTPGYHCYGTRRDNMKGEFKEAITYSKVTAGVSSELKT